MNLSKKQISAIAIAVIVLLAVGSGFAVNFVRDGEAVDMVLCLDDSGSMSSKQVERNQAAMNLVDQLNENVNMGGLYFQYNVTMNAPIRNLGGFGARRDLKEMFSDQHSDERGNTNSGEALLEALSMLQEYKSYGEGQNPSVVILFTDGQNDFLDENGERIYEYIEEADSKVEEAAKNAREWNTVIHTICLNDNDIESLKEVSRKTGGTYTRIDSIEELSDALLWAAAPYTKRKPGGIIGMGILILLVIAGVGGVAFYYFQNFKKQEYLMDYQVDMMKDEIDQRNKREELDAQIREEQRNKKFYQDIVVTHGNAIGGRSCFDNEGRRRSGILSIGDIMMIGRNSRGEDYTYRIDEAGLELWATFDENELILRSKKTPFEIRKEGTARDQGDRTQKAVIKSGQQYYIILGTKHEIGLLATRGKIRRNEMDYPKIIKKCPCCFREISNDEADILIREHEIRLHSPILNDLISPREDEKYAMFWENMGNGQNVLETNRIIITNEMIEEANEELLESGMVPVEKTYDEQSCGYTVTIQEDSMIVVSNTMVCPHCHNVLPQNFFKYDMVSIGLAGSVATGKTVFMASLMMNGFRILNKDNMTVRNAHGNPLDPEKIKMERIAQKLFTDRICPDPTNKSFHQPIYLEVSLKLEKETKNFLVTFYDVAGETIRKEAGSGKTTFARHVDGIIFFVDPSQMFLKQPISLKTTVDEEKILSSMKLLSQKEQAAVQRENKMRGSQPIVLDFGASMEEEDENLIYERNPETILDSLRMGIGDSQLKNKYIALSIAKCDQLSELEEFREIPASSLLFERESLSRGWLNTDHQVIRQKLLENIFEEKVYHLQRNVGEYKESALFCVSALGCETKQEEYQQAMITRAVSAVKPIRVEEPFMWLLMKAVQERGWI